jgi:hypothetical protein
MATAREFQPIAVIRDADPTTELLARLDQVLCARRQLAAIATAIPESHTSYEALLYIPGSDEMLHTVQWWGTKWRLRAHDETNDGERRYRVYDDFGEVLALVWPKVANAPVTYAAVAAALRAPHWTEDKTLTDEERAERERAEAGHA